MGPKHLPKGYLRSHELLYGIYSKILSASLSLDKWREWPERGTFGFAATLCALGGSTLLMGVGCEDGVDLNTISYQCG